MAFVMVKGGVYHHVFSLVALKFLVETLALRILRLLVSHCLFQYVRFVWGEGF